MNEKNKQNISIVGGQFKLVLVPLKRQSVLSGFAISDLSVWSVLFAPVSKIVFHTELMVCFFSLK